MELVVIKDMGRNMAKGRSYDLPLAVWRNIAKKAGVKLDSFAKPAEELVNVGTK